MSWMHRVKPYVPAMVLASLLGTYLDSIMVRLRFYAFPWRPFPELFDINVLFTLVGLPAATALVLHWMEGVRSWRRAGIVVLLAFLMTLVERVSETLGWFVHSSDWRHICTFGGYLFFMGILWGFHRWLGNGS